jgi:type IV pilus assembly protein PilE
MKHLRRRPHSAGFTMIELMVVVLIVGVLAAIAIPIYGKYIKNARLTEATGRMGEIITAAKAYAQEHQDASGNPTWPPAAGGGIVDLTSTELFDYTITAGGGANANTSTLTIHAAGKTGTKMAGVTVDMSVANISANGSAPSVSGL